MTNDDSQSIILDTNILQYLASKDINPPLVDELQNLEDKNFYFTISDITKVELLSNLTKAKEEEALSLLKLFKTYQIDDNVLVTSSRLSTLYHDEKVPNQLIELPDKIIASTALLTGSLVWTANFNDFPRPFFTEVEEKDIFYKRKNRKQLLVTMLLRPNFPLISQWLENRK